MSAVVKSKVVELVSEILPREILPLGIPERIVNVLLPVTIPVKSTSPAVKEMALLPAVKVELNATVALPAFKATFAVKSTGALKLMLSLVVVKLPEIVTAPAPI